MNKTINHECCFVPRLDGYEHCECGNKVQVYDPVNEKHINHNLDSSIDLSDSIKIKVLAEAGFPPTELQEKYLNLLEFVKSIANHTNFNETEVDFIKFYAKKENEASILLEQIGEL